MSLDNIRLQPFVLKGLFKSNLVELEKVKPVAAAKAASSMCILGQNRRLIIILVKDNENVYLPEAELNFLIGILSACQLTMEDTGIVNISRNKGINYKHFGAELPAEKVILFGIIPINLELPLTFPPYQLQSYNDVTYLLAPALSQLMEDKIEKMKLWNSLKQLFNI